MLKILGLDHIVLSVHNIDAMLQFYCDILGCKVEKTQPDFGLTQLRIGDSLIDFLETKDTETVTTPNLVHFCLRVADYNFDELQAYFEKHDIDVYRHGKRYGAQGSGYSFYLKDPQGNEIELKEAQ
ncbi:MAG: VOC family virulence protein [Legionellales bacterium]|nr:VOC family virulence protein [Legionellales bacterium]|tara:strand:- start:82516 stop:82893 length:378 start_codon:yes stop_codon:yes gene_type:complete